MNKACFDASDVLWVTSRNDIQYGDHNTETDKVDEIAWIKRAAIRQRKFSSFRVARFDR